MTSEHAHHKSPTNWECFIYKLLDVEVIQTTKESSKLTNTFELLIVKSGKARLTIDQESFLLFKEEVCIIHPSQVYSLKAKNKPFEFLVITFDCFIDMDDGNRPFMRLQDKKSDRFPLKGRYAFSDTSSMMELGKRLFHMRESDGNIDLFQQRILFEKLLHVIIHHIKKSAPKDTLKAMEKSRMYMEHHFQENMSIEHLASRIDVSPKYFSSLFKKEFGISVTEYVTRLRINKAKSLLIKDIKIRDVANEVGYNDEYYLSRKFKQLVGMSPSAYRERRTKKIAAYDFFSVGHLLALNIYPFAAPIHPKWTSYYFHHYRKDIPIHLSAFQVNKDWQANIALLEKHSPDVILAKDNITQGEKAYLATIAPVIYYPQSVNWRKQFQLIAAVLGEEEEAQTWLKHYEEKVAYTRQQLKNAQGCGTIMPLRFHRGALYYDNSRTIEDVLYGDLHISLCPCEKSFKRNDPINLEDIIHLNPDSILLNVCQETKTLESWESLKQSSLWHDIRAVRNHSIHFISSDPWREYSASAHDRVLNEVLAILG
ncbi:AraC family transcriptional regulator [Salipaludibacillus agaradhaerens]|uniref:AraC family transcriptional regulator n=1 Tax=Salipaludibacillus agaradhaerens TaxID=76935 RepID=A0A9Q4B4Z2_SALAG|nr:AraC family transcriptional regulator [Salipaludibacillus agaradhaerens]MCR6098065.1 AraC family transcriptional regulator [Salipaludibacillus agaradhaerens]MCR6116306.1 AraC family transcriptional regulator [Salipaludibacillus agaradhaerens]